MIRASIERFKRDPSRILPGAFVASGILAYTALPLSASILTISGAASVRLLPYAMVALLGLCGGLIFPAVCHASVSDGDEAGKTASRVYFANILGSVAGPLFTTFYLMDHFSSAEIMRMMGAGSVCSGLAALLLVRPGARSMTAVVACSAVFLFVAISHHEALYRHLHEKLHFKSGFTRKNHYRYFSESRTGTAAVGRRPASIIWGGGVYDGKLNLDPVSNTNLIRRAYMISALHRNPETMLDIGLSGGSWARVALMHPLLKSMDVVEISTAYLDVIRNFPDQAEVLTDSRVRLFIDDGRRFLMQNPDKRYDFILMNATLHWRSQATSLLSVEFLTLCRGRLRPGGVVYYNATESPAVVKTAAEVFRHVVQIGTFVAASDSPFDMTPAETRGVLKRFELGGKQVFDEKTPAGNWLLEKLSTAKLQDAAPAYRARDDIWVITDDNLASEFKEKIRPFRRGSGAVGWKAVLAKIRSSLQAAF